MEIIITIVILAIFLSFILPKISTYLEKNDIIKLKSDIILIKNGLQKEKTKRVLTQENNYINSLDNAKIDKKNEELFSNILTLPIKSTTTKDKENGFWAKVSNNKYIFFTSTKTYEFSLENSDFICISKEIDCKELE
ncbi:hypothetical protein ACNSOO_06560 [Aliarcobacter lanthieri]|uniref:hypothetical protein n=1 Tax=Aliarcobacter lanthieri TaxID=1355374 RepID=UPI00047C8CC6|nr:hypothetical protein [Aliarcobacter lanthieri]